MVRIGVTRLEYLKAEHVFHGAHSDGWECLETPAEEASLVAAVRIKDLRHVIVGIAPYTGALYGALRKGAVVARFGVGHDNIDKTLATARQLLCTNTPGALDDSVAEHTLNLMLAAVRHTPVLATETRNGQWRTILGSELSGKTLAVLGCGAIGRRVARIARFGFCMKVRGFDLPTLDIPGLKQYGIDSVETQFKAAVADADFVSLHLPSLLETRHFLNRESLALLPPSCWLINTGRGSLVDEAALYDALAAGRLAGAALDVFEREPYDPVDPGKDLRALPNVIMTPHVSSATRQACDRMARSALESIALAERGEYRRMPLLNPEVLANL